ncbi:MAG: hypothetical protein E7647_04920 [Ruminococcaceae bacterium]|nr:hypothetical protein [Oscillospiraceae bacterium]
MTIGYIFGRKLFARWEDIREIQTHSYKFFYDYRFVPMRGGQDNFHSGRFPKSRKLRKLIERYWNGII